MAKYTKAEQAEAVERLRGYDWEKDGLLIVIKSVSRSGMMRRMQVYSRINNDYLTYPVARAIGWSMNDDGIAVGGCGMDMAFHLADTITWAVFPNGTMRPALKGNGGSCIAWKTL